MQQRFLSRLADVHGHVHGSPTAAGEASDGVFYWRQQQRTKLGLANLCRPPPCPSTAPESTLFLSTGAPQACLRRYLYLLLISGSIPVFPPASCVCTYFLPSSLIAACFARAFYHLIGINRFSPRRLYRLK